MEAVSSNGRLGRISARLSWWIGKRRSQWVQRNAADMRRSDAPSSGQESKSAIAANLSAITTQLRIGETSGGPARFSHSGEDAFQSSPLLEFFDVPGVSPEVKHPARGARKVE